MWAAVLMCSSSQVLRAGEVHPSSANDGHNVLMDSWFSDDFCHRQLVAN